MQGTPSINWHSYNEEQTILGSDLKNGKRIDSEQSNRSATRNIESWESLEIDITAVLDPRPEWKAKWKLGTSLVLLKVIPARIIGGIYS